MGLFQPLRSAGQGRTHFVFVAVVGGRGGGGGAADSVEVSLT